ncbi:hypothetical protein HB364_30405 [Pseudoflavitalea sp. X16]|uniref:hypothetical protein n=1 Tax=Paraflavitalea devenefica TaxID=2716334 RepID=UPI00141EF743|nr:hypothetical protein [Paraflavitalea devenefica]NII29430.1 hypothetical protein [Paraflavitalea devenefica]
MKSTSSASMKIRTVAAITVLALSTGLLFASCKKDSEDKDEITDEEVAEAVTQSVSASSGGMVVQTESTAKMAGTTSFTCGQTKDTTIVGQSVSGAAISYNYSLNFNRTLTCSNGIPSLFQFNFTGSCNYSAPRMSSADNSTAQFSVTGLEPTSASYIFNASYVRNGTQQSKVRFQRSFSSTITITAANITVDKATQKIVSGTATVEFVGNGSGGYSVNRGGTLTFLGNNKATLALKNGSSYNIQW